MRACQAERLASVSSDAVDKNAAACRRQQAEQQIHQRRLAAAGLADEADARALGDDQADILDRRPAAAGIGKADVFKRDRRLERQRSGVLRGGESAARRAAAGCRARRASTGRVPI